MPSGSADVFPVSISKAMRDAESAATCVPVRLGGSTDWETAMFVQVAGPECQRDRKLLREAAEPISTAVDARLMAHEAAAIVSVELTVATLPDDPLRYEILLVPGRERTHYQAIKLLARQQRLCWFFGDDDYGVLQAQEQAIESDQHECFESIAREAFAHDSLLRISDRYDSAKAIAEIVSHYTPRTRVGREVVH